MHLVIVTNLKPLQKYEIETASTVYQPMGLAGP